MELDIRDLASMAMKVDIGDLAAMEMEVDIGDLVAIAMEVDSGDFPSRWKSAMGIKIDFRELAAGWLKSTFGPSGQGNKNRHSRLSSDGDGS